MRCSAVDILLILVDKVNHAWEVRMIVRKLEEKFDRACRAQDRIVFLAENRVKIQNCRGSRHNSIRNKINKIHYN